MSAGWVERDGVRTPLEELPPSERFLALDGDLYARVGGVDRPRLHVRLRGGEALCGRVRGCWMTPSRHHDAALCRWCLRIIRGELRTTR